MLNALTSYATCYKRQIKLKTKSEYICSTFLFLNGLTFPVRDRCNHFLLFSHCADRRRQEIFRAKSSSDHHFRPFRSNNTFCCQNRQSWRNRLSFPCKRHWDNPTVIFCTWKKWTKHHRIEYTAEFYQQSIIGTRHRGHGSSRLSANQRAEITIIISTECFVR